MELQKNKVVNLEIVCSKLNGVIVHPNEVFSFWQLVGRTKEKDGYLDGLTIKKDSLGRDIGGGICQMANIIHYLILNSPLTVVEIHHHSDALFPDDRRRVPFGTGTSIFYKNVDYRFKNTLEYDVQLLVWIKNGELCGELRGEKSNPYRYKLIEEDHHYIKEGSDYFRISRVYKVTIDKKTNCEIERLLVLKNHSKVLYDSSLIPADEIREGKLTESRKARKV